MTTRAAREDPVPPGGSVFSGSVFSGSVFPGSCFSGTGFSGDPERYAEAVLALVEAIPPGRVVAYGDVAEMLGAGGPRQVGRVLSHHGGGVPWWRVIRADGSPPTGHEVAARREWAREGTPLRPGGKADMAQARWSGPAAG